MRLTKRDRTEIASRMVRAVMDARRETIFDMESSLAHSIWEAAYPPEERKALWLLYRPEDYSEYLQMRIPMLDDFHLNFGELGLHLPLKPYHQRRYIPWEQVRPDRQEAILKGVKRLRALRSEYQDARDNLTRLTHDVLNSVSSTEQLLKSYPEFTAACVSYFGEDQLAQSTPRKGRQIAVLPETYAAALLKAQETTP